MHFFIDSGSVSWEEKTALSKSLLWSCNLLSSQCYRSYLLVLSEKSASLLNYIFPLNFSVTGNTTLCLPRSGYPKHAHVEGQNSLACGCRHWSHQVVVDLKKKSTRKQKPFRVSIEEWTWPFDIFQGSWMKKKQANYTAVLTADKDANSKFKVGVVIFLLRTEVWNCSWERICGILRLQQYRQFKARM